MEPVVGQIYRHFKGNLYEVKALAIHSETGEKMVVYEAMYGDYATYVRPYDSFVSKVDKTKYPDALQEYRFEPYNQQEEEISIHPLVLQFLDTDDYNEKYGILESLQPMIDDNMIGIMATSMDITIEDMPTAKRYQELLNCVDLRRQFESTRLR